AVGAAGGGISAALGNIASLFPAVFPDGKPSSFFFPPPRTPEQLKKGGNRQPQQPQRRARQGGAIFLVGSALRVRYAIPAPALTRWGEAELIPANRADMGEGFFTGVVGNSLWPIIGASFKLRYLPTFPVSDSPPVLPNPLQGGGGRAAENATGTFGD